MVGRPPREIKRPGPRDLEARIFLGLAPDDDNYYVVYFKKYHPKVDKIGPGMVWAVPRHPDDWYRGNPHKVQKTGTLFVPGKHLYKLSKAQVEDIRRRATSESVIKLATEFGVNRATIYRIRSGRTWRGQS